ncbi:hypothetical protein [Paracidovorax wautersii]|uniref:Transposase n=1 Tax=Paracidovorax wautersii TaxID=1177982 RepID=A0ABU1I7J6_9BURK|nr:hypothetical protein [Paracidovorax wautersii]MDR6213195.1 hypothetical protein [Paracidovorax wautersii]
MSKTYRHLSEKTLKPRELKRQRQREAMLPAGKAAWHAVFLPEPEAPVWKPLG